MDNFIYKKRSLKKLSVLEYSRRIAEWVQKVKNGIWNEIILIRAIRYEERQKDGCEQK